MNKRTLLLIPAIFAIVVLFLYGCDKERIVESSEIVRDVEYVTDTLYQVDTVFVGDSVTILDTVIIRDTVTQVQYVYDTTIVTDTVATPVYDPNSSLAFAALQYHTDPLVMDLVYTDLGISEGYIFYQSFSQLDLTQAANGVYDIYGYIDFWTTDWSGYYPIEYYWRMSYTGGDPANPANWQIGEPPATPYAVDPGLSPKQPRQMANPVR